MTISEMDNASNSTMCLHGDVEMQSFSSVYPIPWHIFLVSYAIVLLTTIGGNAIVIASYVQNEFVRATVANAYILNLSISDVLVGSIVMLFDFLNLAIGCWPFGDVFCAVWLSAHYFVIYMSVVTVIVISMDRLWLISDVLRYKRLQNRRIAMGTVLAVWIYTTLYTLLYALSTNDITNPSNRRGGLGACLIAQQDADNRLLSIILENLDFFVPLVLLITANVTVAAMVRSKLNNRRLTKHRPTKKSTACKDSAEKLDTGAFTLQTTADHCNNGKDTEVGIQNGGYREETVRAESNASENTVKNRVEFYDIGEKPTEHDTAQNLQRDKLRRDPTTQRSKPAEHANRPTAVAKNLFLLTSVYVACWLPYHMLVFLQTWRLHDAPRLVWEVLQRLIWFNSMVNPFLYAKMNIRFRLGMLKLILFRRNFQHRINRLKATY